MDYDIVIATANRPDILRVSLPTMMRQTRPAKTLIITDASDDHESLARTVREVTVGAPFEVQVHHTKKGAAIQRNAVLQYIESPVVFFPDDDSLWYDDVGEQVMRIYERDTECRIGGVGQAHSDTPPRRLSLEDNRAGRTSALGKLKYRVGKLRHGFLDHFVANPLHLCGQALLDSHPIPSWLPEFDAVPTVRLVGFRRSYRTDAARRHGFCEDLHWPRGAFEDFEQSFAVLRDQILVEATRAKVYHHQFSGGRTRGVESGVQQFLNTCFVVCRNSPPNSMARKALDSYTRAFIAEAALLRAPTSTFERERLEGIRRARRAFPYLLSSPPEELTTRYNMAFERCLRGELVP